MRQVNLVVKDSGHVLNHYHLRTPVVIKRKNYKSYNIQIKYKVDGNILLSMRLNRCILQC